MVDSKNLELKIKDSAKDVLEKKIKPGQVVLLALNDGSNGCANMHPSDAAGAYNSLEVNEPVIIY